LKKALLQCIGSRGSLRKLVHMYFIISLLITRNALSTSAFGSSVRKHINEGKDG
jgi:hypothetical protein